MSQELDAPAAPTVDVSTLRELFRNLVAFRSFFEATGNDTITGPDGELWSLWDIEHLYDQTTRLPKRQRQAVHLFLFLNYREKDAAIAMGVSETNPVAMYATSGLTKIVGYLNDGSIPRFSEDRS